MDHDLLTTKLHVDAAGEVWYSNANGPPIPSGRDTIGFLMHPICNEMPRFRICGMPQNVQLTLALHLRNKKQHLGTVEICSPMVCPTAAARSNPYSVLMGMRQFDRPASLGGWHYFGDQDYRHYALVSQLQKVDDTTAPNLKELYQRHPAYKPLSFIPHLNHDACARLLALIIDPRWYLDAKAPNRGSKLRAYLGLDSATMLGVLNDMPIRRNHERCALVLSACSGNYNPKLIEKPDHFLLRIARDAAERSNKLVTAKLRMAQAFIEYLRLTWIAELACGKKQAETLFAADHFFKERYEVKAFKDHEGCQNNGSISKDKN